MDYLRGKIKGKYSQPSWESYQESLETPLSPILPLRRNISPLFPRRSTGRREGSEKSRKVEYIFNKKFYSACHA